MAKYRLRAVGADFDVDDDGCDYADAGAARRAAVKAGIAIAAEEIAEGKKSSIVEAQVLEDDRTLARYVIALGVEALLPH
jgi:hypothetical protein